MVAINKAVFARYCVLQANFCGVNPHYLTAVAQLRSGIDDGTDGDRTGPFLYTQAMWDRVRTNKEFEIDLTLSDIGAWRFQCTAFAAQTHDVLNSVVQANAGRMPSAIELYIEQLAQDGTPATAGTIKRLTLDFDKALRATSDVVAQAAAGLLRDARAPAEPDPQPKLVLFSRTPGMAAVRGHLVTIMQEALMRRGHLSELGDDGKSNADGIFGEITERAIETWQAAAGYPSTGAITLAQWRELTGAPTPDIYDLCAQLTAGFEGTGFGGTNATNFDHTILTFGYHGYTLTGGSVVKFLRTIEQSSPGLIDSTFGVSMSVQLRELLQETDHDKLQAKASQLFLNGNQIKQSWRDAFQRFGETSVCQKAQLAFSRKIYWAAAETMRGILGVSEPLSHALCFDVSVQNGRKNALATATASKFSAATSEFERRIQFGEAVAQQAKAEFRSDVRKRKVDVLGSGIGQVHESTFQLENWGFAPPESAESNDAAIHVLAPSSNAAFDEWFRTNLADVVAFSPKELLVKGRQHEQNHLNTDPPRELWANIIKTVRVLVELKRRLGNPAITLNSVYRGRRYNESVGGARDSQHMKFTAADFVVHDGRRPSDWADALRQMRHERLFLGGIGVYRSFVHVDTRGHNTNWG